MTIPKKILILFLTSIILPSCKFDVDNKVNSTDIGIDSIISIVENQQIVVDKNKLVDSLSSHTRHLTFQTQRLDSNESTYLIKVCEDNGTNLVTYFNFLVDRKTMTIINPNGKLAGQ